ncbi:MAG: TetR/AcrR family transcriptional regulator [Candidatus Cloacimonetes bacterium]|jgi:AcrR family transcriptional regulator|nr:TetR/AcrR family transcriptional regulator [Candidatus Cloacimonadota bacterium]MCB5286380.1 TetR/AcrR family transcriptional regulator [Candidatus Cloacimonadota bacterium]MCK9184363.1 TetR/AcrR family transcriptional regulator [Candidatus Cloacimonadota bacterium]MCK9584134.1 TetR/AcrR family transcriptional regulator [Candidatus Cloacimonadota bacterium]MDY0228702.1 TetR/AcrR family transcriptional regulator [Candidatus Cloacimonadaceae bacterium]
MNKTSKNQLRTRLKESTREAILEAAAAVILKTKTDIRMEDIAAEAGVAIGTLYNYFTSRQELMDTITQKRRSAAEAYIRQSQADTEGMQISSRLRHLFQTLFKFLEKHRAVTHHSLTFKLSQDDASGQPPLIAIVNEYVLDLLQTALQHQEIRPEYMDIYPLVISAYIKEIFAIVAEQEEGDKMPDYSTRLVELFMKGAQAS